MADALDTLLAGPDPVRAYVAERIKQDGWTPFDAINWALDREAVDMLRCCVMFVRLCDDPIARADPNHGFLHQGYGIKQCPAGWALVEATQRSLDIPDERAKLLIDQMDEEMRALEALVGSE